MRDQTNSKFQSQTGSQALSDRATIAGWEVVISVSIPNGKPGPLRHGHLLALLFFALCFNPKREARPSQTRAVTTVTVETTTVSIPNGKPGPLRR